MSAENEKNGSPGARNGFPRLEVSISRYALRLAVWNFCIWLLLLWFFSGVIFYWLSRDGMMRYDYTFFLTVWAGVFVGLVGFYSTTLQTRRVLLLGFIVPSDEEWIDLGKLPERTLAGGFWRPAVMSSLALAAGVGGFMLALSQLGDRMGYERPQFLFYTTLVPAVCIGLASALVARYSVERFVSARRKAEPLVIPRRRYVWLHNVLPYSLVSSAVGLVAAFARFGFYYQQGKPVPEDELALHLAVTALFTALILVAAARFKTRVDWLSPIELSGSGGRRHFMRWRYWYALLIAAGSYGVLRLGFLAAGCRELDATNAVIIKVVFCLLVSSLVAAWGVTSALGELSEAGFEGHPYVRLARRIREKSRKVLKEWLGT
ncbi:MAG TPA: hypothetical protein VM425_12635 [Myxococcota bacterium]|nr:hypothetical protein [Myxococcota bacterium]